MNSTRTDEHVGHIPDIPRQFARSATLYFVVVGVLGVLLRARYVAPVLPALRFDNVVHAHSHVAYFGWAALALMAAIYSLLPRLTGRSLRGARVMRWQLGLTHVVTLGALVTFSTGGYTPLSIVFSTLNVVLWYVFIWLYRQNVKGMARPLPVPLRYLNAAVALLFVSSLGTWLISAVAGRGGGSVVGQQAGLNIFLTNFTDGWLLLGLLGVGVALLTPGCGAGGVASSVGAPIGVSSARWASGPLPWIVGLTPLTFLAELVSFDVPAALVLLGLMARFALAVPYTWFIWNAVTVYRAGRLAGYGFANADMGRHSEADSDSHSHTETGLGLSSPSEPGSASGMTLPSGSSAQLGERRADPPRALRALVVAAFGFFVAKAAIHAVLGMAAVVPSRQLFVAYLHLDLLGFVSCGLMAALYFAIGSRPAVGRGVAGVEGDADRALDPGTSGAIALSFGVTAMVATLAVAGALGGSTDNAIRTMVNGLFQAAFVSGVVAFIGIVLLVVGVWRHLRGA